MLLQIKNLNAGFHTEEGFSAVLHDVSLSIKQGETVALVGESPLFSEVLKEHRRPRHAPRQEEDRR